ncbi:MAG TPA: histidine phosphatase family protein, partial [Planctomycetota bacterium]|nr:histidine phosphatase family protein [Planctomycetota bacterium]
MLVYLLRHGTAEGQAPGQSDAQRPLTADGRDRLQRACRVYRRLLQPLDVLRSSPLLRAQQTAAPIAAAHGLPVLNDHRLIESRNFFEGRKFEASPRLLRDPRMWSVLRNPLKPSWGEPYTEIAERMLRAAE